MIQSSQGKEAKSFMDYSGSSLNQIVQGRSLKNVDVNLKLVRIKRLAMQHAVFPEEAFYKLRRM